MCIRVTVKLGPRRSYPSKKNCRQARGLVEKYLGALPLHHPHRASVGQLQKVGIGGLVPKVPRPFGVQRVRVVPVLIKVAMAEHVEAPLGLPYCRIFDESGTVSLVPERIVLSKRPSEWTAPAGGFRDSDSLVAIRRPFGTPIIDVSCAIGQH
jgi:hypothetical protein